MLCSGQSHTFVKTDDYAERQYTSYATQAHTGHPYYCAILSSAAAHSQLTEMYR